MHKDVIPTGSLIQGNELTGNTAEQIMNVLKGASKTDQVNIAGIKVEKPGELLESLKGIIFGVQKSLGVTLDANNVFFKKLEGNVLGKATKQGVEIDSIMLLHPVCRLAHVIAHEALHARISNDGMIEAYLSQKGYKQNGPNGLTLTKKYIDAENDFADFINEIRGELSYEEALEKVYRYYYEDNFEGIYKMYAKNYLSNKNSPKTDKKDDLFKKTFPELILTSLGTNVVEPYFQ